MTRAVRSGLLGATLTGAGLVFALPSLVVPGAALLLLVAAAATWVVLGSRRAAITLEAQPDAVEEGQPVAVRARARIGRAAPTAELVLAAFARTEPGSDGGRLSIEACARFDRRGERTLGPARLSVGDPLGLCPRIVAEASARVLVLPRVEPVRVGRQLGFEGADRRSGSGRGPELEFEGLRPYRAGAPAGRIHWPTAARTGRLLERHLTPEADTHPLVVLDSAVPDDEESLDRAVRAAASLCRALAAAGGCRILLPGDRRAVAVERDLRAFAAVHRRLALVEPQAAPPRAPRTLSASSLLWVLPARRRPPRALLRSAARERYLVVPGEPPRGGQAFTVAGCSGIRIERASARAA